MKRKIGNYDILIATKRVLRNSSKHERQRTTTKNHSEEIYSVNAYLHLIGFIYLIFYIQNNNLQTSKSKMKI